MQTLSRFQCVLIHFPYSASCFILDNVCALIDFSSESLFHDLQPSYLAGNLILSHLHATVAKIFPFSEGCETPFEIHMIFLSQLVYLENCFCQPRSTSPKPKTNCYAKSLEATSKYLALMLNPHSSVVQSLDLSFHVSRLCR